MWLLRLLAVILVLAIGLLIYAFTGNRNYLAFSGRLFKYGIVFALIIFALMIIERVAIIPL